MDCHSPVTTVDVTGAGSIALVGHPNVGKSVLFQRLTGQWATVSNYPGTTVEIARAAVRDMPDTMLVDTPGVIAFPPRSDDEWVTEQLLFSEPLKAILQVGDAKNLCRTLLFSVQLAEMGVSMVLGLNMIDEADARGVRLQPAILSESLGLPVVPTTAIRGRGVDALHSAVKSAVPPNLVIEYPQIIDAAVTKMLQHIPSGPVSARALALMWLGEDPICQTWLEQHASTTDIVALNMIRFQAQEKASTFLGEIIQQTRLEHAKKLAQEATLENGSAWRGLSARLGALTTHPIFGVPILLAVLYGLYWFEGIFGAGTLVGLLEENLFGKILNPWFTGLAQKWIPIPLLTEMIVGEYGLWTMGMTYALALILPIVTTFFLAFGMLDASNIWSIFKNLFSKFLECRFNFCWIICSKGSHTVDYIQAVV